MKNLYQRKGGKVHPSSANSCRVDAYSVLRLLPVAIATLKAALPPDDQEVLAYLIARSPDVLPLQETQTKKNRPGLGRKNGKLLRASTMIEIEQEEQETQSPGEGGTGTGMGTAPSSLQFRSSSSSFTRFAEAEALLRRYPSGRNGGSVQKEDLKNKSKASQGHILRSHLPSFECSCFQCYMGFWSRWDASPNRERIHEAIDLFEDHMAAAAAAEAVEASSVKGGVCKGKNRKGFKSGKEEKGGDSSKAVNPPPWGGRDESTDMQQQQNAKGECTTQDLDAANEKAKSETSIPVWGEHEDTPKSKQIAPLAFEEDDSEGGQGEQQQKQEARAGACPLGGRSLMRRMFPDIMGFVADHLWTAWSSPIRATNS